MITDEQFRAKVRIKISGWYSNKELEDNAVVRMAELRANFISLLQSTGRDGINNVIDYLDDSGFFYRASSAVKHHNFPGGLAEHCMGTYLLATKNKYGLPEDSVKIAALLHDICKADRFWFKGRTIKQHTPKCEMDDRHSVRSIFLLGKCNLKLTESERLAIRWHMKGEKYHSRDKKKDIDHTKAVKDPLWKVIFYADKDDAAAHPGRKG